MILKAAMIAVLIGWTIGIATGSESLPSISISLDGDWAFTRTPVSSAEIPEIPPPEAFDAKIAVPGLIDAQLDRLRQSKWWTQEAAQPGGMSKLFDSKDGFQPYLTGLMWYRRTIDFPRGYDSSYVELEVGSALGEMNIWLNGRHLGGYKYGTYTPYVLDVSDAIRSGEPNELVLSLDNTKAFMNGSWACLPPACQASGITRSVRFNLSTRAGRIADAWVRPGRNLKEMSCEVELCTRQGQTIPASRLWWAIRKPDSPTIVKEGVIDVSELTGRRSLTITACSDQFEPWSDRSPNLYLIRLEWVQGEDQRIDERTERFGLRRWSSQGRKLFLNGQPIYLRGDFGAYYYPIQRVTPTTHEYWHRYLSRLKELGLNFINFAARVAPPELLDEADELGVIVQNGDHMTVLAEYRDLADEVWRPILKWTRGHPSMCIYGFGGERSYYEGIIEQFGKQYELIKSMHPDSLVMPQQAIRGIDYNFDERAKKELTSKAFWHHAGRLAEYTKVCDLFGHYSSGAFSYNYFEGPWREMEKRFTIYEKPLVAHELFLGTHFLNPDNAARYTGLVKPLVYTDTADRLQQAGLLDRWPTYFRCSAMLQGICKKYCVEKTRKCNGLAGYEFLGMCDQHFTKPEYGTGMVDEFLQLKPGDTLEGIHRYSNESVLLIDHGDRSLNRSFSAGEPFEANLMVSLYGPHPITKGTLNWNLTCEGRLMLKGQWPLADVPTGQVSVLKKLKLTWPEVAGTHRMNLAVRLKSADYRLTNDWDFWIFEKRPALVVNATVDEATGGMLASRYSGLKPLGTAAEIKLHVVSAITPAEVDHLERGGDVLLLGTEPFTAYNRYTSFRPGLGHRSFQNVGFVIAQHPVFTHLPHDGWADWQFYPVLEGAPQIVDQGNLQTTFDPILEVISSPGEIRKQAAIMEKRVGKGRLLASTCVYDPTNPSCVALMDGIFEYVGSVTFKPTGELPQRVLRDLCVTRKQSSSPATATAGPDQKGVSNASGGMVWYNQTVKVDFGRVVQFRINNGKSREGRQAELSAEGVSTIYVWQPESNQWRQDRQVAIDLTPPIIRLSAQPGLDQEGGAYLASPTTRLTLDASDAGSGVRSVEVAIDAGEYAPYAGPFSLPSGDHEVRCRAIDNAGNRNEVMTGQILSGGPTSRLRITIK